MERGFTTIHEQLPIEWNPTVITAFQVEKDPDLLRDYDKIIQEQEQTRIVERVPEEESSSNVDKEQFYYSPDHAVIRKDRETT